MSLRGWSVAVAIVVGMVVVVGVVFALDVVPGLSVESVAGLLPSWAVSAKVSHTVVSLTAKTKTADVGAIVTTLERFAASHGFVRDADGALMVKASDPDHLRRSYTGPRASLSFYTEPGEAVLALESEPGRDDKVLELGREVRAAFGPLGFESTKQP